MQAELEREKTELVLPGMQKPYFIEYRLDDFYSYEAVANYGALTREEEGHQRIVRVTVRIGNYGSDSSSGRGDGTVQLAPQDMVAFMYPMTPVTSLTFTRNRDSMIATVSHFEGRKGIYEPRNEFEERYAYYPTQTVERIRNDITMGALSGAAVKLGGMRDGRKSIIFVSEGFTATVPAQLNDPVAALPGMGNRAQPGVDVNNPRAESQKFFDSTDLQNRLREVYDTVNRNNTSIYAVDPRGLAAFEYDINQGVGLQTDRSNLNASIDSLRVLADNTDGRAIVNRNDLAAGMKQIMRDASGYYLLGYTSSSAPTDGKFHTIDVRVKRPNVEVRSRRGYWAYTAEDAARASAPPLSHPLTVPRALPCSRISKSTA